MKNLISIISMILLFFIVIGVVLYNDYAVQTLSSISTKKAYVAIIIDDFGNNRNGVKEMMDLDIPITVAVMPFLPYSVQDAQYAHKKGLDVILHMPMEPNFGKPQWLGKKAITSKLNNKEIRDIINESLNEIKYAVAINNHMGSKITQNKRIMREILQVLKERDLFFIDSKTTSKSVSKTLSNDLGIVCLERDIFLDNKKSYSHIQKQMNILASVAHEKGYAIAIGHVGPEGGKITAEVIKKMSSELKKQGIEFVGITTMKNIIEINNNN
ncbi:divergent polysaccharide deacetylase family protein [Abyssisolibacter fermentans]|uniref:divergent polysaccharide deacetylase family protein n=1 Tax=Abyssisolibacter fermentans TaxID=1766203 RepID=UPI00082B93A6|nr:divergent polysaccharide deacetylase family protein [Abyssisolibacter fermentans]